MLIKTTIISSLALTIGLAGSASASQVDFENLTIPEAVTSLTENICVRANQTSQPVQALLPSSARAFTQQDLAGRLHTRPYAGDIWAVPTLEGLVIIGTISDTPGGCQVLAATPFSDVLSQTFQTVIQKAPEGFELTSDHGSGEPNNGVTWNRYKSTDGLFLDTLMYAFKGSDKEGTLHVVFKP